MFRVSRFDFRVSFKEESGFRNNISTRLARLNPVAQLLNFEQSINPS